VKDFLESSSAARFLRAARDEISANRHELARDT
jgi:hypothetical protein